MKPAPSPTDPGMSAASALAVNSLTPARPSSPTRARRIRGEHPCVPCSPPINALVRRIELSMPELHSVTSAVVRLGHFVSVTAAPSSRETPTRAVNAPGIDRHGTRAAGVTHYIGGACDL